MARLLLLSNEPTLSTSVLPSLALLTHQVRMLPAEATALLDTPPADVIAVDARTDLLAAKSLCTLMRATGTNEPILVILSAGGLAALNSDWGCSDFVLDTVGPGELETRLRLLVAPSPADEDVPVIASGGIEIDEAGYAARLHGVPLDLTYTEFELLKYLVQHPGRVFSRQQLLSDVWGYDYYGGTRTVDVHIRRLRAKLGTEYETLIGTVRGVGYRFVTPVD